MSKAMYDLIIIGAGPAGITAGIYAARRNLRVLLISRNIGGQVALTSEIENYPGFEHITGFELVTKFKKQAEKWDIEFKFEEVVSIKKAKNEFTVNTFNKNKYQASALILAFGLAPRELGVPGEKKFKGKGVTYCATCDGPLYRGKTIGIVGGGNSALEAAEYMSKIAKKIYLIHRSDEFRADPALLLPVQKIKNVEFYCDSQIKEIKGDKTVRSVVLSDSHSQKVEELKLGGLFIEIGYESQVDWLKGFVKLNKRGEVIVDRDTQTSVKGVFGAGDCTDTQYKQIVISAGDGAKSALQAYKYISASGETVVSDLGKCELVGSDGTVKVKLEK